MEFQVLGPVHMRVGEEVIALGPPQQRLAVAILLVGAGRQISIETLIDGVWDEAPAGARRTLHVYLSRFRRLLEQASDLTSTPAHLKHQSGGYRLAIPAQTVDLHRLRGLVAQANDPGCPDGRRVGILRKVVAQWQGQPLSGLTGRWAEHRRAAWHQERIDTVVAWAQTELRLTNPTAVIGPLTDLHSENPLSEPIVAVLMHALSAANCTPEALDLYLRTKATLADELGIDPGSELQQLYRAILRRDLDPPPAPPRPQRPPARLRQLPPDIRGFVGRGEDLHHLDGLLAESALPAAVVISAVNGAAGIGKTALAVHWAHRMAGRFPDGQLYVNLRGFDPGGAPTEPAVALRGFLDAMEVPPRQIPADLGAQIVLYRSRLAGKRMLVVLDNARDAEQVRPLLPGAPGCLALVTSRSQLTGLMVTEGAQPWTLDLLSTVESRELLTRRLGRQRIAADPGATAEIISSCARLPLALAIAAARAATRPDQPLAHLAAELRHSHQHLDAFDTGDRATNLRAVFSWSYEALSSAGARLFRLLGLHPGPDITAHAAASLAGVLHAAVAPLLAELTRAHLIAEHLPGRYRFHDLIRAYALEQAHVLEQARSEAIHRMLDHYLRTACTAQQFSEQRQSAIELAAPQPDVTPEDVADHQQALEWFIAESPVLLGLIDLAARQGFDTHTWQLAWTVAHFFSRRGRWHDLAFAQESALTAAQRLGDKARQASIHNSLGSACFELDRHDEAVANLQQALALSQDIKDLNRQTRAYGNLSKLHEQLGDYERALENAECALECSRAAGFRLGEAVCLNSIGWQHIQLGDYRQGLIFCQDALALHRELGEPHGLASTLDSIGCAYHHLGEYEQAIDYYQQALQRWHDHGDLINQVDALTHIGDAQHANGNQKAAGDAWQRALHILDQLGHPDADQLRTKLAAFDKKPHGS